MIGEPYGKDGKRGTTLMPKRSMLGFAMLIVAFALVLVSNIAAKATPVSLEVKLAAALSSPQRSTRFVARDAVRHPAQELAFFGLRQDMSVLEIWPGACYRTEILAPVLRDGGHYEVALPPPSVASTELSAPPIGRKLAADPAAAYDKVVLGITGKNHPDVAPPDSVDLVLSFRNLHNWMADGYAPSMFAAFFKALKHGGILGIEEHRGNRTGPQDPRAADGYVRQAAVISFAKTAGFVFVDSSEVKRQPERHSRLAAWFGLCQLTLRLAKSITRSTSRSARPTSPS